MTTAPRKTPVAAKKTVRVASPAKAPEAPATTVEAKVKKPKLVRDSFTIPKNEYSNIESLKQKSALLGSPAKKSELLRAGIQLLTTLSDAQLRKALAQIPTVKTGRPNKQK
jgi:hypothetical protein